jgi:HAD superfamily hydrolase (TIGR01548 family)
MVRRAVELVIFDVDGVLVDVSESFHRTTIETVRYFTGRRVSRAEIHRWKNRSGYNDDWKLTTAWIRSLGRRVAYEEVKRQYQRFYWGKNGNGNVARERWLLPLTLLRRWSRRAELGIFTGRTRRELRHTLERFGVARHFRGIVTLDDVERPKPAPEGLLRILDGRDPTLVLYAGDNVDDALAARRCGIGFIGVLPRNSDARRLRARRLRELGAKIILGHVSELESCWP